MAKKPPPKKARPMPPWLEKEPAAVVKKEAKLFAPKKKK